MVVPGDPNGNCVSSRRGSNLRTQLSRRREGGLVQTVPVVGRITGTLCRVGVQAGTGTGVLRDLQTFPRVAMAKTSSDVQTCEERSTFKRFERLLTGRSNTTKTRSHPYRPPSPPSSWPVVGGGTPYYKGWRHRYRTTVDTIARDAVHASRPNPFCRGTGGPLRKGWRLSRGSERLAKRTTSERSNAERFNLR